MFHYCNYDVQTVTCTKWNYITVVCVAIVARLKLEDTWATFCRTVRSMLSDCSPVLSSPVCLQRWCIVAKQLDGSRCHIGAEIWCRPRSRPHSVRWGPSSPSRKGAQQPPLSWFRPGRHCVRWGVWGPTHPMERGTAASHFWITVLWHISRPSQQLLSSCLAARRPTCMPSFILIRPTVWPQYTNVTDRTGQTDNSSIG